MLAVVLAVNTFPAKRIRSPEPAVAIVGTGVLGTAWVLPQLWAKGITPIPPCIFHTLTGQPCPFCGGTRSFAAMAHGNLAAAVHVFPIGPLLFVGLIAAVIYSSWSLVTGRRVRVDIDPGLRMTLTVVALAVLMLNWASKLFFLGY
jgi:hypothetical protein